MICNILLKQSPVSSPDLWICLLIHRSEWQKMRERFAFHLLIFVLPLFWHTRYDWQFWLHSLNELEDIMHQNYCYKLNLRILGLTRNLSSPCVTGYFYAHDTGGHRKKSLRWQRLTKIGFMFIWWGLIIASLIHANYLWGFFERRREIIVFCTWTVMDPLGGAEQRGTMRSAFSFREVGYYRCIG